MQRTAFFYLIIFLKIQTEKIQTKKKPTQDVTYFLKTVWTFLFENICMCCQILTKVLIGVTDVSCGGFE